MKNEINEPIFTRKYAQNKNETFEDMCNRVAYNDNQKNLMLQHIFMPAGRQLVARGSKLKRTLFNCYAIGFRNINNIGRDSKAAINDIEARSDEISSRGGGIGINFSVLRPKDD
jgi:ribonucleoside-diphosphate reductase alpha chain